MTIYLSLTYEQGDPFYVAETTHENVSDWLDKEFVRYFEEELYKSHTKAIEKVLINGSEFSSCEIFKPKDPTSYSAFVAVTEDYLPLSAAEGIEKNNNIDLDISWINRWIAVSRKSESYHQNFSLDLSTKYIAPKIVWDDESIARLTHPDVLRRSSRVLLLGPPGAGKTLLVRFLTQRYLREIRDKSDKSDKNKTPLVFYIQLRNFADKSSEFNRWLSKEEDEIGKNFYLEKSSRGSVVFVFDGFDELNSSDQKSFTSWLVSFLENRPASSTIVTSRELNTLDTKFWKTFRTARLQPFDQMQIEDYCELVIAHKERSRNFIEVLNSNPDYLEFLRNPLSLSLALGMYSIENRLPINIGILCKELANLFVEKWDSNRGIVRSTKVSNSSIKALLGRLAYSLQTEHKAQFRTDYISDFISIELEGKSEAGVLKDIRDRTGLLVELGSESWTFSHRYFQDFFCANYLVERASGLGSELDSHGHDSEWIDVWRQVSQLCQDPEFFAESNNRRLSDSIVSIDRLITTLITHDGLSKLERDKIIGGLSDELHSSNTVLPDFEFTDFGAQINCAGLNDRAIKTLAQTIVNISYLKGSDTGSRFLEDLGERTSNTEFAELVTVLLRSPGKLVPQIGGDILKVFFKLNNN